MFIKKINIFCLILAVFLLIPSLCKAEDIDANQIVINEVQSSGPGADETCNSTCNSNKEFIEITNLGPTETDLSGWKIKYINTTGSNPIIYTFTDAVLAPDAYSLLVCKNAPAGFLSEVTGKLEYSNCLAASGVGLSLLDENDNVVDSVSWDNSTSNANDGIIHGMVGGQSLQRQPLATGETTVTFIIAEPTPATQNYVNPVDENEDENGDNNDTNTQTGGDDQNSNDIGDQGNDEQNGSDESNEPPPVTYFAIELSELMIDPASPLLDSNDEWVEIYNPSAEVVDVSGYKIFSGTNFTYQYTFPNGTKIGPHEYLAITSGETPISLSNSEGAAKITAPDGTDLDQVTYSEANTGQTWAKDSTGNWQWTILPTKSAPNQIIAELPVIKTSTKKSTTTVKPKTSTASTKKSTSKATKVKAASTTAEEPALISAPSPLPSWLLAFLGVLAISYACYEYRFEVSNYIYKFKQNRRNR